MIEIEKRYKLTKQQFNKIKNSSLEWSDPYKLTDIVFSLTGNFDIGIGGTIVRLREHNGNTFMDYKSALDKELTKWEEIDIQVNDFVKAMKFLLKIGLSAGLVLERMRMDCIWDNFRLTLDKFDFIGHFLEIELIDPNKNTNFNLFSTHFDIELGDSQPPYGKIMLKKMENNINVYQKVNEYIKLKTEMTI